MDLDAVYPLLLALYVFLTVMHIIKAPTWVRVSVLVLTVMYLAWILFVIWSIQRILQDAMKTRETLPQTCRERTGKEDDDCGVWHQDACYRGVMQSGECVQMKLPFHFFAIPVLLIVLNLVWIGRVIA